MPAEFPRYADGDEQIANLIDATFDLEAELYVAMTKTLGDAQRELFREELGRLFGALIETAKETAEKFGVTIAELP